MFACSPPPHHDPVPTAFPACLCLPTAVKPLLFILQLSKDNLQVLTTGIAQSFYDLSAIKHLVAIMSSSTPPVQVSYSGEEKEWLKCHFGGEYRFLRTCGLSIFKDEDRLQGRAIAREFMRQDEAEEINNTKVSAGDHCFSDHQLGFIHENFGGLADFMSSYGLKQYDEGDCDKDGVNPSGDNEDHVTTPFADYHYDDHSKRFDGPGSFGGSTDTHGHRDYREYRSFRDDYHNHHHHEVENTRDFHQSYDEYPDREADDAHGNQRYDRGDRYEDSDSEDDDSKENSEDGHSEDDHSENGYSDDDDAEYSDFD